ncbi:Ger(x)C family spore germination protein [Paenibacillus sp. MWE-103]|uniref:Ger(X)C family spore germination protein n=1 Tax=Paenibacillus artemisiicola TaxID=1172618 RepID=A0ABS3W397_9BACL|nr:Ger(x)C family spore germination protein [Paenibacillus artemisiicola]MBO7742779.1 Ger(x)C family spore germination protein [Paenibacillus artemisiicola]
MNLLRCACACFALIFLSGCWDRTEINDLAFITGAAFDKTKEGAYLLSVQIAIPSVSGEVGGGGGGGKQKKFFVLSAVGKDANEAFLMIQKKSSRKLFTAHRSVIFIGEAFGRQGIGEMLDVFTHDPRQRLRTYMLVVKGGQGRDILQSSYPFEQVPVEAVKEMEIGRSELAVTLRDFFMASSGQGVDPVIGVIQAETREKAEVRSDTEMLELAGTAVFKDLKLVGMLDGYETDGFMWAAGRMKQGRVNAAMPDGGVVGMEVNHAERRIVADASGKRLRLKISLTGEGTIIENNSRYDISRPDNLDAARRALEKATEGQVRAALTKLQKQFRADSAGFGSALYRRHPKQWRALQGDWHRRYAEAVIAVDVQLKIGGSGMAGPPLQLNDKEIIK